MSLRTIFEEKLRKGHKRLNELLSRKEKGEDVNEIQFTNKIDEVLGEVFGKDPPDPLVPNILDKMIK